MKRIGLAASKIAQGNLWVYNIFVLLLSFLFSLMVFFISGFSIFVAIVLIAYIAKGVVPLDMSSEWGLILRMSMIALTVVIGLVNLVAVLTNVKISKAKI